MSNDHEFEVRDDRIHCDGCEGRITRALGRLEGIAHVEASHDTQRVRVTVVPGGPGRGEIERKLAHIGFPASPRT